MHLSYLPTDKPSTVFLDSPLPLCGGGEKRLLTSLGNTYEITQPPPLDKEAISRRLERF